MKKVICFGSLNIDYVYQVPHFVRPGETLSSVACSIGAGGKGGNQSTALARAGASVVHAGRIGRDGRFMLELLEAVGVDTRLVTVDDALPSGHAIIQVVPEGENAIILNGCANTAITPEQIDGVFEQLGAGDILLLQNEISRLDEIMARAARQGVSVALNFAPFEAGAARRLPLETVRYLILNETEAGELAGTADFDRIPALLAERYPQTVLVLTLGGEGAMARDVDGTISSAASPEVEVVDTTAAGDTFVGYFLEAILRGLPLGRALARACGAGALAVSRAGAADSIPSREELDARFPELR